MVRRNLGFSMKTRYTCGGFLTAMSALRCASLAARKEKFQTIPAHITIDTDTNTFRALPP